MHVVLGALLALVVACDAKQQASVSLDEGITSKRLVIDLQAEFDDVGSLLCNFAADSPPFVAAHFEIDANGVITTKPNAPIDREALNNTNDLVFRVICTPGPKQKTITVTVLDKNDNEPTFPEIDPTNKTIDENAAIGKTIFSPSAYDADIGTNTVTYAKLIDGDPTNRFDLRYSRLGAHQLRIWVELVRSLDRETVGYYQLEIEAYEGVATNPRSATLLWNITVGDVNDNPPEFNYSSTSVSVPENSQPGDVVKVVRATDVDENPVLTYEIVARHTIPPTYIGGAATADFFRIDAVSGRITLQKSLDHEFSTRRISLAVRVWDGKFQDSAVVNVHVTDVNDNRPTIDLNPVIPLTTAFDEGPGRAFVSGLTIKDGDPNDVVSVKLMGGFGDFIVQHQGSDFYLLKIAKDLDRETRNRYRLTVNASDQGGQSSTWSVDVTVRDVNDNAPSFVGGPFAGSVSESARPGTVVTSVSADDPDEGMNGEVVYFIPDGQPFGDWFSVDSSGVVKTNKSLDRELIDVVSLKIVAGDKGSPPLESNAITVTITIDDVNDNAPKFDGVSSSGDYRINASETLAPGTVIATLTATDADAGDAGKVTYSFVGNEFAGIISLNSASGKLTLDKTLDRETKAEYAGRVKAADSGNSQLETIVSLVVSVEDVNDNLPVFYPIDYDCYVYENASVGHECTRVHADDEDANPGVRYRILAGNEGGNFDVNARTGAVALKRTLDSEEKHVHLLVIGAEDSDGRASKQNATVRITVANVIDKPPLFDNSTYGFVVNETATTGTRLGVVRAVNQDFGLNGTMEYVIVFGDPNGIFRIGLTSGEIVLAKTVDREKTPWIELSVQARCCGAHILFATVPVNVSVEDANDNSPVFGYASGDAISVPENLPHGTPIADVNATDLDAGANGILTYTMTSRIPNTFAINSRTGMVTSLQSLDYETMKETAINVTATDGGNPARKTTVDLVISVVDVNDHSPVFARLKYSASVLENATLLASVVHVSASDKDSGENGDIFYTLSPSGLPFDVRSDGEIVVSRRLDAEKERNYSFDVIASDRGSPTARSAPVSVFVSVVDVNDNSPIFSHDQDVVFGFFENVGIGYRVGKVNATDADSGRNGLLKYEWTKPSSEFVISSRTGVITTTANIDRETTSIYILEVVVSDGGVPSRSTSAVVTVNILDVNDNSPTFDPKSPKSLWVWESAAVNDSFGIVSATDPDAGSNANLTYAIASTTPLGNDDAFSIDPFIGSVILRESLDRETTPVYVLNVTASDGGSPSPRRSWTSVTVVVGDVNDNSPTFLNASVVNLTISEAVALRSELARFVATDRDNGSNADVVYSIASGNLNSHFTIDSKTGVLRNVRQLDFETLKAYTLVLHAQDQSPVNPRTASIQVNVKIADANDHQPKFENLPQSESVFDDVPVHTSIYKVAATDVDTGANGRVFFSIHQQDPAPAPGKSMLFSIDRTSGLVQVQSTDFNNAKFTLTIMAKDQAIPESSRLNSTAILTVNVVSAPNDPVRFTNANQTRIVEDAPTDSELLVVSATSATGRSLTYSLIDGNVGDRFKLNALSGRLQLKRSLDREIISSYWLTIQASDGGTPPRIGVVDLRVIVLDVNDNRPDFGRNHFTANVTQGDGAGTPVIRLNAIDDDLGPNGTVTYSISGGNSGNLFSINNRTGHVSLQKTATSPGQFNLVIRGEDNGLPRLGTTVDVTVDVLVPRQPPDFQQSSYLFNITENLPANTTVGFVNANDVAGRSVQYKIQNSSQPNAFFVMPTGEILARQSFDFEKISSYVLYVEAYPTSDPSQKAVVRVDVNVLNVNDNSPRFEQPRYTTSIREMSPKGTRLVKVTARDDDLGIYGDVQYSIEGADGVFSIDAGTGVIRSNAALDREKKASYVFGVRASEIVAGGKSAYAPVQVQILDLNDNSPAFAQSVYNVEISSQASSGTSVVQTYAVDADGGINGTVSYRIVGRLSEFQIDSVTGLITTTSGLQAGRTYMFAVVAEDEGVPPLASRANVSVAVIDPAIRQLPPRFLQPLVRRTLLENSGVTFRVVQVEAVSDRSSATLRYGISAGNAQGRFAITPDTGRLTLAKSLDAASENYYDLTVEAKESVALVAFMHVFVNVTPVDSDLAKFISPRDGQVLENLPVNSSVLTVTACSPFLTFAECNAQKISYHLENQADSQYFTIDETSGELRTNAVFDAEGKQSYDVVVSAVDLLQGGSGSATIQIRISDENDNKPTLYPLKNVSVAEDAPKGTLIASVSARDDDVTSDLLFFFQGGSDNKFSIESQTGKITLRNSLDYEKRAVYPLTVGVTDTVFTTTTTFFVHLTDVNDNAPVFDQLFYSVSMRERQSTGTPIVDINATDADSGANGEVRYRLQDELDNRFAIDSTTGVLRVNKSIVYVFGQTNDYVATVIAYDMGQSKKQSSLATVTVTVDDVNDHVPAFAKTSYALDVAANVKAGSTVGAVTATDLDKGENGQLNYRAIGGNGTAIFAVQSSTGNIEYFGSGLTLAQAYVLRVRVADLGTIPGSFSNETIVYLYVVSERRVVFQEIRYAASINETAPLNTDVVRVHAVTETGGSSLPSSSVSYSLRDPSGDFSIDSSNGQIKTQASLNFANRRRYDLTVVAQDVRSSSRAEVPVVITVLDFNGEAPVFTESQYHSRVPENSQLGIHVLTVEAQDSDKSQVIYSIKDTDYFAIDKDGSITLTISPDYEKDKRLVFHVIATDNATVPRSSTATVVIDVTPVNEQRPVFAKSSFEFDMKRDLKTNDVVGVVSANDGDSGVDGDLVYFFLDEENEKKARGLGLQMLTVSSEGHIVYNDSLIPETDNGESVAENRKRRRRASEGTDYTSLIVAAKDKGPSPMTATAQVVIKPIAATVTSSSSSPVPSIIGALVGILVLVLIFLVVFFLWRRRRRRNKYDVNPKKNEIIFMTTNASAVSEFSYASSRSREVGIDEAVNEKSSSSAVGSHSSGLVITNGHARTRSNDKLLPMGSASPRNSLVLPSAAGKHRREDSDESSAPDEKHRFLPSESDASVSAMHKDFTMSTPQSRTVSETRTDVSEAGSGFSLLKPSATPDTRLIMRGLDALGLNSSRESMHDFNIQGGGEAEVGLEVQNMLHSKLAEADADEDDAMIDGTRTFTYEGTSDSMTMTPSVADSFSLATDDDNAFFYRPEYDHGGYFGDVTRGRNAAAAAAVMPPPPGPAPVRPNVNGSYSPHHPARFYQNSPMTAHGRRSGLPPAANRSRPANKALRNNGLSPCISPGVSVSSSLATTPNETPAPSNLSPISMSPTASRKGSPSLTQSHSSLSSRR
ncbi:protocadherin-16-like [Oscarella lobularis]|uniref:protocadherin-16-like n=1 Tax=Oscarella lobularis TaxID=121494 RepID=UPI003313B5BA